MVTSPPISGPSARHREVSRQRITSRLLGSWTAARECLVILLEYGVQTRGCLAEVTRCGAVVILVSTRRRESYAVGTWMPHFTDCEGAEETHCCADWQLSFSCSGEVDRQQFVDFQLKEVGQTSVSKDSPELHEV